MIITLVLIPLVILKTTPKIKALREEIKALNEKSEQLLKKAYSQMQPLNSAFTDEDALNIIEKTVPLIKFNKIYSVSQEKEMQTNYDFCDPEEAEQTALDVLSGTYNGNPFLFENKLVHTMGTEIYHGYKTIHWTEAYRDSNGKLCTRTKSETLHATVVKPKPFYNTRVVLNYGSQAAPDLLFSRSAGHIEKMSEKEIEKHVKKGEKKLKKLTDNAINQNKDFVSMANSDFEVLFNALNRNNEVQYRTLFTPLAQTNLVSLMRSKNSFGDDFDFIKIKRMNRVISNHSCNRALKLYAEAYKSYSYDIIKENFIIKNTDFFKSVYFDFAPVLSIPVYQERPVHSLDPLPDYSQLYSYKECEILANRVNTEYTVHPNTKTRAIIKSNYISTDNNIDKVNITAYSYDIIPRVDVVSVYGGDGHFHNVPVNWDEYIPLENESMFYVSDVKSAENKSIVAQRNGLCIFK